MSDEPKKPAIMEQDFDDMYHSATSGLPYRKDCGCPCHAPGARAMHIQPCCRPDIAKAADFPSQPETHPHGARIVHLPGHGTMIFEHENIADLKIRYSIDEILGKPEIPLMTYEPITLAPGEVLRGELSARKYIFEREGQMTSIEANLDEIDKPRLVEKCDECGASIDACSEQTRARILAERYYRQQGLGGITARDRAKIEYPDLRFLVKNKVNP